MPFFFSPLTEKKNLRDQLMGWGILPTHFRVAFAQMERLLDNNKKREKEKKYVYRGSGNVGHGLPFFFLLLEGGLAARQCLLGLTYFLTRLRCCCRRLATTQKRGGAVVFFSGGSLDDVLLVYQNNRKNVISRELLSHDLYLTYEEERSGRMWTPRGGKFFFSEVRRRRRAQS